MIEAAHAGARAKGTYLKDKFHRLRARRGYKKAAAAVANKILTAACHMLAHDTPYRDLGDSYLDELHHARLARSLVRRLERMGYEVQIDKAA